MKKQILDPEINVLYQFHAQKALFKAPKICNTNFRIENAPPPLWHFSKNSSDLVAGSFPKDDNHNEDYNGDEDDNENGTDERMTMTMTNMMTMKMTITMIMNPLVLNC